MIKTRSICTSVLAFAFLASTLLLGCETLPKGQDRFEKNFRSPLSKEHVKNVKQKAESGDVEAQFEMGMIYYFGNGVAQDYNEAVEWYKLAAEQGLLKAKYWLDISLGLKEKIRKAELGDVGAQKYLGLIYYNGEVVSQNCKEAVKWFTMAAEQGDADAQNNMGVLYQRGEGVRQDYVQAYKWYNLASAQQAENAKENRDILRARMTPAQIAEAQRLSREFRPRTDEHAASPAQEPAAPAIMTNGTGFFITPDGYLLTAYHVVKEAAALKVWAKGRLIPAQVVRVDAANDIALLKMDGLTVVALPVISSRNVRTGLDVFTLGFPNIQLQGTEVKYTQGNISSLTGAGDDPRLFQISVPVQPGNSGGPLLDEQGQVIGVVIAKLNEIFTARATGSLPQNVNYALKSSLVLSFLESLPELSGRLVQTKNNGLSRTQVVKQSGNAVVMVLGY